MSFLLKDSVDLPSSRRIFQSQLCIELREKNRCGHIRKGGGGVNPFAATKIPVTFFIREKAQNVQIRRQYVMKNLRILFTLACYLHKDLQRRTPTLGKTHLKKTVFF